MKKALALLLACLTLLPLLVSCGDTTPAVTTGNAENVTAVTNNDPSTPDLPTAAEIGDISGDFHFLVAGNWAWNDYEAEEESSELVEIAIYERNKQMEDEHGITITTQDVVAHGTSQGQGPGFQKLYTEYMSGTSMYDAAMVGTYDVATVAYTGLVWDMNRLPYINLEKDYWDQQANKDLSVNGKMYYTTGDISVADNRATYTLFFSKKMVDDFGLENPYDLVKSNQWTFEKFSEMTKSVGSDADLNGVYDTKDVYGLMTPTDTNLAILSAADERICTIKDGKLELTFYSDRVETLYTQFIDLLNNSSVYNYQTISPQPSSEDRVAMLDNNQALFYSHTMFYIDYLRECENNFGILPYPKYDETQESYKNLVSAWHSQFLCVPLMCENVNRTGYVLEKLAYLGQEKLTPAYYEKTLQGKYVRDAESSEMLDIIFDSLLYDVGIYYNVGTYREQLAALSRTRENITVLYERHAQAAQNNIETINNAFAKINY